MTSTLMARSARAAQIGVGLKRRQRRAVHGLGGHDHGFSAGEHGRAGRGFGISGAQVLGLVDRLALQQSFRGAGGEPAAFLGDADRHDFVFAFIDGVDHGRGREQRDFVLTAASAEQNSHAQFFHDDSVWTCGGGGVKCRR